MVKKFHIVKKYDSHLEVVVSKGFNETNVYHQTYDKKLKSESCWMPMKCAIKAGAIKLR